MWSALVGRARWRAGLVVVGAGAGVGVGVRKGEYEEEEEEELVGLGDFLA